MTTASLSASDVSALSTGLKQFYDGYGVGCSSGVFPDAYLLVNSLAYDHLQNYVQTYSGFQTTIDVGSAADALSKVGSLLKESTLRGHSKRDYYDLGEQDSYINSSRETAYGAFSNNMIQGRNCRI